jgi:ribose-phosphate pyrophosphokinase
MSVAYMACPGVFYDVIQYPAGEVQVRLPKSTLEMVRHADEVRVVAKIQDGNFMLLSLLMSALRPETKKLTLILPYLPYGRADRRFVEGDCAGLEIAARMINAMYADRVVTLDAHNLFQAQRIFNLVHVMPTKFFAQAAQHVSERITHDLCFVLPDAGAKRCILPEGYPVVQCTKIRDAVTGKLSGFKVPKIPTEAYLIVDDICDGGGTFLGIAAKIGVAHSGYLAITHGIFSKGHKDLNMAFDRVYCTNSFKTVYDEKDVQVCNAMQLISQELDNG